MPDVTTYAGQHARLVPYMRGFYPRDALYACWRMLEDEGMTGRVFHGQLIPVQTPIPLRGDLIAFCDWFGQPTRALQIVMAQRTQELAGLIWFDDIVPGHRANANVAFRKAYYRTVATEAGHLAIAYAREVLQVKRLWAFTPWRAAAGYALRLGFKPRETLTGYAVIDGQVHDMRVLSLDLEGTTDG